MSSWSVKGLVRYIVTLTVCVGLAACTAVKSVEDGEGVPYALPKGLVQLQVFGHKTADKYAVRINGVTYVPEDGYQYTAAYQPSYLSHDVLTITVAKAPAPAPPISLLEKVDFSGDEKTADFIIKLVELAKAVKKITAFSPQGAVEILDSDTSDFVELYNGSFDPFSSKSRFRMNVLLNRMTGTSTPGQGISIHLEKSVRERYEDKFAPKEACIHSVCFRRPVSVEIILRNNGLEFQRVPVVLPDRSKIGGINVTRAAFVKKVTTVNFAHGMLESITINKPSEALAGVEIPLAVANAVLEVPGEILTLRVQNTTQSKQLHDARLAELKSREALVEFQRQQLEKQRQNAQADGENDSPDN